MNNFKNIKAAATNSGSIEKLNKRNGSVNGFSMENYSRTGSVNQCKICRSDYMRFTIDAVCIDCQQKAEFILKEQSRILAKVKNQGGDFHGTQQ